MLGPSHTSMELLDGPQCTSQVRPKQAILETTRGPVITSRGVHAYSKISYHLLPSSGIILL